MRSIRTFIAFDTSEPIKKEMAQLQSELMKSNADVRWEGANKFHATIKFLGNVDEMNLPKVINQCELSLKNFSKFVVSYGTLGCFPNKKNPRVIWIGCENSDGILIRIKNTLDNTLLPLGFELEDRKFHPHITLGRVKGLGCMKNLLPMLEKLTFERRDAAIQEILIMKSILRPQGAEYSILKAIPLKT